MPTSTKGTGSNGASMRPSRRPVHRDRQLVELVACETWDGGGWRSSHDVAEDLRSRGYPDLNVHGVVSCQHAAVRLKIVTPVINLPFEQRETIRLERLMLERFKHQGITRVCLVPGDPRMLTELERARQRELHAQITLKLALRAAAHVRELVSNRPAGPCRIGVAWGRMLHAFAQQLLNLPPLGNRDLTVYPIVGITEAEQVLPVEANGIASIVAHALGGVSKQLQCPAIVRSDQYALVVQIEPVKKMLDVIQTQLDIVITGMGPIEHAQDAKDITITPDPAVNATLFDVARKHGASGEVCAWCFDGDGQPVSGLPYRSIGLGLEGLQRMASDTTGRRVVLCTGGDKRRIDPLAAAIRGRLASDIITDTITARVLLGEITL
jgi:DNA-binding transcriptional regulator LsrR (DeoR family)